MNWLKQLFSDPAGIPDDGRIGAMAAIFTGLGLAIYAVVHAHQVFDMQAYGIGIGALMAGIGGMLKLRGSN